MILPRTYWFDYTNYKASRDIEIASRVPHAYEDRDNLGCFGTSPQDEVNRSQETYGDIQPRGTRRTKFSLYLQREFNSIFMSFDLVDIAWRRHRAHLVHLAGAETHVSVRHTSIIVMLFAK